MNIAQQTTSNRVICKALSEVRQGLVQGQGISAPMLENKLFPRLLVQMVRVGEETGNLESTLNIVAESYETEANDKLSGLIAMIEPAMTVGLGLLVAFVALSVISPMYSILSSFD
jgi:type IV pilus assembly protein PilC